MGKINSYAKLFLLSALCLQPSGAQAQGARQPGPAAATQPPIAPGSVSRLGLPVFNNSTAALTACYGYLTRYLRLPVNHNPDSNNGTVFIARGSRSVNSQGRDSARVGSLGIYFNAGGQWYFRELEISSTASQQINLNIGVQLVSGYRGFNLTLERSRNEQGQLVPMGAAQPYDLVALQVRNNGDFIGPGQGRELAANYHWVGPAHTVPDGAMQSVLVEHLRRRIQASSIESRKPGRTGPLLGMPSTMECIPSESAAYQLPLFRACAPVLEIRDDSLEAFKRFARSLMSPAARSLLCSGVATPRAVPDETPAPAADMVIGVDE